MKNRLGFSKQKFKFKFENRLHMHGLYMEIVTYV